MNKLLNAKQFHVSGEGKGGEITFLVLLQSKNNMQVLSFIAI